MRGGEKVGEGGVLEEVVEGVLVNGVGDERRKGVRGG